MKKLTTAVVALTLLAGGVCATSALGTTEAKADRGFGIAEYVSVENAPTIDGQIDEVWLLGESMIETVNQPSASNTTTATVDILWNETGLYFLARVTDYTVNSDDRVNLWVSETYIKPNANNNTQTYPVVEGAYFLCLNPAGMDHGYYASSFGDNEMDMTGKFTAVGVETEDGYVVEVYVPLTGNSPLRLNGTIGFDVSVDNYLAEGEERSAYAFWAGGVGGYLGEYWLYPSTLVEVSLYDFDETNGSPVVNTPTDSSNNSNPDSTNSSTPTDSTSEEEESNGCAGAIGGLATVGITVLGACLLLRKKDE